MAGSTYHDDLTQRKEVEKMKSLIIILIVVKAIIDIIIIVSS